MYTLLRQTLVNNQRMFQRGSLTHGLLPSSKSGRSFYSAYTPSGFYNREEEVKELLAQLKGPPTITVLLGPPSSGKTALARQVTSLRRADQTPEFHPLTIDLREADTSKNGKFLSAFLNQACAETDGWWKDWFASEFEVSACGLSAKFSPKNSAKNSPVLASEVFRNLGARLKRGNFFHGERPPLIIIDEANAFKQMEDNTIQTFFNFAVRISKQEQKMHVILTSSDSFFQQWLNKRINSSHFRTMVLGDLPKNEAYRYFLHAVENYPQMSEEMKDSLKSLDFDVPFKMTGGRMLFIKEYITQVCSSGYVFDDPMTFRPVRGAYAQMQNDFLGGARTYKTQQAVEVAQLLTHSSGYIPFGDLVKKLSREVVEEMIERNFLHYQPSADFSKDLEPPPSEPVVTAQGQPALRAMEALAKKYGS